MEGPSLTTKNPDRGIETTIWMAALVLVTSLTTKNPDRGIETMHPSVPEIHVLWFDYLGNVTFGL